MHPLFCSYFFSQSTSPLIDVLTPSPTSSSTNERMLYCGNPRKRNKLSGDKVMDNINTSAGVCCCIMNETLTWHNRCETKSNTRVLGKLNVPACYLEYTFQEAVDISVLYYGGRLCTGQSYCTGVRRIQDVNWIVNWYGSIPMGGGAVTCRNSAGCCSGHCYKGICAWMMHAK